MSFPALLDAAEDPLLLRRPVFAAAYLYLVRRLDFVEYRRERATRVASALGVRADTAGACLAALRRAGYIERGDRVLDVFTYRLVYSRAQSEHSSQA